MSLRKQYVWSVASQAVRYVVQPIVQLILARLLLLEDFKIMGVAMAFIAFANIFRDFGLGQAIIQSKKEDAASLCFTIQLIAGVLLVALIWFLSPLVAIYSSEKSIVPVLRVLSLVFLISPFVDVPSFLSMRNRAGN